MAHIHLEGIYKQAPGPWRHISSTESKLGFQLFIHVEMIPLVHLVLVLVHLVLVLVHLVLVLVSSSCNLENRERERRGERRRSQIYRIFLNIVLFLDKGYINIRPLHPRMYTTNYYNIWDKRKRKSKPWS